MENQDVHGAALQIMEALKQQGSSTDRLKTYRSTYNVFERFLSSSGITHVDADVCMEFVYQKTGKRYDSFECVTSDGGVDNRMRPLLLLVRYLNDGEFNPDVRKTRPAFTCPSHYAFEYEAFCGELASHCYSKATVDQNKRYVQFLITYLMENGIKSSEDIEIQHIENYLKTHEGKSVKYIGTFLYVFRKFFTFLFESEFITEDLAAKLPKVRTPRNATIPHVWSKEDIQKLLSVIDREDPKGKRDYAMLLIAIRLGLRISDIRNLKLSSINWNRQIISIKMVKTGQSIELPLLKDVGWAIIDYLKNGRPATSSECVFVRHRAPFNAFGGIGSFTKELHRYIVKAGLQIPDGQRRGMHSLRNTLAANMLEIKSPLPIISEALGHQSVKTTGLYLKIDLDGLRKCALDPEEVFLQ
ncbi:MAG: tyrosine-type recombinase/integrase [Oscillospiraceae bacterium]|nr:tyrosine-type recombinase/integrase [Oscillospiraceae bacterium]